MSLLLEDPRGNLKPRPNAQLAADLGDVPFNGALRKEQAGGHLAIGQPVAHEIRNLELAPCQRRGDSAKRHLSLRLPPFLPFPLSRRFILGLISSGRKYSEKQVPNYVFATVKAGRFPTTVCGVHSKTPSTKGVRT
jgi:hypothetical protein